MCLIIFLCKPSFLLPTWSQFSWRHSTFVMLCSPPLCNPVVKHTSQLTEKRLVVLWPTDTESLPRRTVWVIGVKTSGGLDENVAYRFRLAPQLVAFFGVVKKCGPAEESMSLGRGCEFLSSYWHPVHSLCFILAFEHVSSQLSVLASVAVTCCQATCWDGVLSLWNLKLK